MKVDVLLGLQWGDEGKGKVVDVLTPKYDVVARFQGGPNAGHTLEFEGQKYVLRSIPSGIFQGNKVNIIGNGVLLDKALIKAEAEAKLAQESTTKEELEAVFQQLEQFKMEFQDELGTGVYVSDLTHLSGYTAWG